MSECESSVHEELESMLVSRLAEVRDLRDLGAIPEPSEGIPALVSSLRKARASADRVESIMSELVRLRARCQKGLTISRAAADDAWDAAANAPQSFNQADASPRERYARYKLASMAYLRDARRWESAAIDVEATLEIVKNAHHGIRAYREDVHTLLRAMTLEDNLSRG